MESELCKGWEIFFFFLAFEPWCWRRLLRVPWTLKEIHPVHSKGDQSWVFLGRNDAEAETPILWPPHAKSWLIGKDPDAGKDWRQEEKGMTADEMVGWHHWLNGLGFGWTLGVGDGQGGPACYGSWGSQRVGHDWATEPSLELRTGWASSLSSGVWFSSATISFLGSSLEQDWHHLMQKLQCPGLWYFRAYTNVLKSESKMNNNIVWIIFVFIVM